MSWKKRTIAWKKMSQTSTSAKYLRCQIRGSVPRRDWKTRAMCPEQGLGSCQTYTHAQSERQGCILFACRKVGSLPSASAREFVVHSGASMHMVSEQDPNSAALETMRTSGSATTVVTANGEVRTKKEATVCVEQLDLFFTVMFLQETPAVPSLGKLCEEHGYTYHWKSGQKPHLSRNDKWIDCNISSYVPLVVRGLSASSSSRTPSPTSPSSSSQGSVFDVNRYTENPVPERSGSTSEELRGDLLHESTEIAKHPKKRGVPRSTKRHIAVIAWLATGIQRSMKVLQQSLDETQSKEVKTLPSHLMIFQWSREHTWNRFRVSVVNIRIFRRTQIAISAWRPK